MRVNKWFVLAVLTFGLGMGCSEKDEANTNDPKTGKGDEISCAAGTYGLNGVCVSPEQACEGSGGVWDAQRRTLSLRAPALISGSLTSARACASCLCPQRAKRRVGPSLIGAASAVPILTTSHRKDSAACPIVLQSLFVRAAAVLGPRPRTSKKRA